MITVSEILQEIDQRIREYENTAEEYFQELDNAEDGDKKLSQAEALKSLKDWIDTSVVNNGLGFLFNENDD